MDRTEISQLEESLERARVAQARELKLREIGKRLLEEGRDLPALARATLDALIGHLEFERGFLLVSEPPGEAAPDADGRPFKIFAARARRRREAREPEFEDVANPEFAINRSAAKRAFQSAQPLRIQDCLIQPQSAGAEIHRSVLCQPFAAAPGRPAVIYLDRALGSEPVLDLDLTALAEFAERCLPLLARGFLTEEVILLRERVRGDRGSAGTAGGATPLGPNEAEDSQDPALPPPAEIAAYQGIVGSSEKMRRIFQVIEKIRDSDLSVCIFGESGTGKELIARAIHASSSRREKRFVSENCGTMAESLLESELFGHLRGSFTGAEADHQGLFQAASGGTLFLDEIGDMSEGMQRKLLRVLQEGVIRPIGSKETLKVDARVVCASNRNLAQLVQRGAFRIDLFYRVNVISIEVPPLRERMEDLPLLTAHFLEEIQKEEGTALRISQSAMNAFREYAWPGNVRELRNVVRRAAVTCSRRTIARKDVTSLLTGGPAAGLLGQDLDRSENGIAIRIPRRDSFNEIIGECERVILESALKECRWNKSKVVKLLKIPRQSLYNMIAKHGLRRKWEE